MADGHETHHLFDLMLGEIEVLYTGLYKPYEGFREARTMVDERILTRFDKLRMKFNEEMAEARTEVVKARTEAAETKAEVVKARTEVAETKAEVARNLLKAGVAGDIILQATGLTITDIENQTNIVSAPAFR